MIDELVTKQLEIEGSISLIVEHVRYTYACSKCRNGSQLVTTSKATGPDRKESVRSQRAGLDHDGEVRASYAPVSGAGDAAGTAGHVVVASLVVQLIEGATRALKPLADQLLAEILKSCVVQVDETPVRFLPGEAGKSRLGYLSGYAGDEEHRFLWTTFPSRSRDGPQAVLAGYRGVLLTDGYSVYESLVNSSAGRLIAAACWMHARRGSDECVIRRATRSSRRRWPAFGCCTTLRSGQAVVMVDRGAWHRRVETGGGTHLLTLEEVRPELRPSTKLAEAIGYVLHRKEALSRFLDDGRIPLDTGLLEKIATSGSSRKKKLVILRKFCRRADGSQVEFRSCRVRGAISST